MNPSFKFALGFLALLLLVLCIPKVGYAAPPQPCSLLTQAQVSKTLGTAVLAGKSKGQFDCEWDQVGWTMAGGQRVLLHVLGPVGSETPAQRFNTIKRPLPFGRMTKTPVSGVGDDAVYMPASGLGPELTVKKGEIVFQVVIQGSPRNQVNEIEAKEKALALDVLAKL